MNIERFIAVYEHGSDSLAEDIRIDLPSAQLIEMLDIDKSDDPDLHKSYEITATQFARLKAFLPGLEKFDFNEFEVRLECFSIE